MDYVFLMVAVLISAVCGKHAQPVKEKSCETKVPGKIKCKKTIHVQHGRACYHDKSASISCSSRYSFNTETVFECKEKPNERPKTGTWSPTDTTTCSLTETTSPLISTSNKVKTTSQLQLSSTISISNSPDVTTFDTSSLSATLYSTTRDIQTDITESMFTPSFRSTLLPSEDNIFPTTEQSATPSLTTPVLQSVTSRPDYTTRPQTELQTLSITEQTTSISVSASTQPITAMPKEVKDSDIIAVYITVPAVVCIIAIIGVFLFLLWRHRRRNSVPTVRKREKGPGSSITNKTYEVSTMDRHCSLISLRKSLDSGYTEILLDTLQPEEASGNVYQTIDNLPEAQSGSNKTYGHLKQPAAKFIDMNYSHINTNKTVQQSMSDTTYAHTETDVESLKSKDSLDDGDSTYNRLNTIQTSIAWKNVQDNQVKENGYKESEYNHAKTGSLDPENQADDYSHLNGSSETQPIITQKENHQYHDNDKLSKVPTVEPYEFGKEPESPQYELAKEPEILQYELEKGPRSPHYETAKDVDISNSVNPNRKFADKAVKQEYEDLNQEFIGTRGYEEVVVGNSNDYFILEPEDRPSSNDESFHVAGDFSVEKGDTFDYTESVNHQYFTLEKTDT